MSLLSKETVNSGTLAEALRQVSDADGAYRQASSDKVSGSSVIQRVESTRPASRPAGRSRGDPDTPKYIILVVMPPRITSQLRLPIPTLGL